MKLEVDHIPLALLLQIGPDGTLIEGVLKCEMSFEGGVHFRDIWAKDMSIEWRQKAQELINEAVKILDE